jgi:Tol biopolymer transport system component
LGPFDTLTVVDANQPEKKTTVSEDGLAGFFWSLDGRRLAYFTAQGQIPIPSASGSGDAGQSVLLKLTVLESWTGKGQTVAEFIPTLSFLGILSAFDQYQHSVTIWSPDSRNLVLSSYNGSGEPGIYVVEASKNLQPLLITGGYLGFWSWR